MDACGVPTTYKANANLAKDLTKFQQSAASAAALKVIPQKSG